MYAFDIIALTTLVKLPTWQTKTYCEKRAVLLMEWCARPGWLEAQASAVAGTPAGLCVRQTGKCGEGAVDDDKGGADL